MKTPATAHVHHVGRMQATPGWHLGPQSHPHHELIVMLSGATRINLNGTLLRVEEGEVVLFREMVAHEEWTADGKGFESIFLSFTWTGLPRGVQAHVIDRAGRLRQLARWLYAERASDRADVKLARDGFLQALLGELVRLSGYDEQPLVDRIRSYVRQHLAAPLTVDDLATQAGLSKFHFIRMYRAASGRTPMADVRALRLDHARDLILTTRMPLKQIADQCGLGDPAHFSRVFREHLGMAPSRLRAHRPTTTPR